jgi:pimeloyl-ACP methyl ester carboxylesterase
MKYERGSAFVRGLEIAYHVFGDRDRPTILALHGFLDHARSFEPIAEALSPRYSLVALDFRGFGESSWIGAGGYYHFVDYVEDATRVLELLPANPPIPILAHSMGGGVAVMLAATKPDRISTLVLLEGMGPPAETMDVAPYRLRRWLEELGEDAVKGSADERRRARRPMRALDDAVERLRRTNPRMTEERARALAEAGTERTDSGLVWRFDPLHRTPSARPYHREEYQHFLRSLEIPVLSLYGSASEWALPDIGERHADLRQAKVGLVDGAGHNIHHDRPDVVAAVLERWLSNERREPPPGVVATSPDLTPLAGGRW